MSPNRAKAGIQTIGIVTLIVIIALNLHSKIKKSNDMPSTIFPSAIAQPISKKLATTPIHSVQVKKGDTLAHTFNRLNLNTATLKAVTADPLAKAHLNKIKAGQTLVFTITAPHQLKQITFAYNPDDTLYVRKSIHGYKASIKSKPPTLALRYTAGHVKSTFEKAALAAGLNKSLLDQFTQIFHDNIDFQHGIHHGDHFAILYEEYYVNGKRNHAGHIMAAEFTSHGKTYRAFRYTYPKHTGYYTLTGQSLLPLFLKAPVDYGHISSFFTYHRMDPYLHTVRPHLGIDYAAPKGTPIHSIGTGRIIFVGKENGYGNSIVIRYSDKYKTLYGHMDKFAQGIHAGEYVERGQIIGYIGDSGWSTGPHLHFEMYVDNVPRDPLQLKFPNEDGIPIRYTHRYLNYSHRVLARFNLYENSELAENDSTHIITE